MELVIDTSAIVAVIGNDPQKGTLVRITQGADLLAPASVPWEIGNAFSAMLKRGRLDLAKVQLALDSYRKIPIRLVEADLSRAVQLCAELNIYAYDAYLISCAQTHKAPLLSLDRGLIHAARQAGVSVLEVL